MFFFFFRVQEPPLHGRPVTQDSRRRQCREVPRDLRGDAEEIGDRGSCRSFRFVTLEEKVNFVVKKISF